MHVSCTPGSVEETIVCDGDEVEARGTELAEQRSVGYRETAAVQVLRGTPGRPVTVARLRRGPR